MNLRRPSTAAAAAPNRIVIGGAGTGVPLLPPEEDEPLLEELDEEDEELEPLLDPVDVHGTTRRQLPPQDRAAFDALYRAVSAKLFGICYRILNDRAEAEEARKA